MESLAHHLGHINLFIITSISLKVIIVRMISPGICRNILGSLLIVHSPLYSISIQFSEQGIIDNVVTFQRATFEWHWC